MKNFFFIGIILPFLLSISTVEEVHNCWNQNCLNQTITCSNDQSCVNAGKYMDQCELKLNCNQNLTITWNETCWEFCNYEATPATTAKTWIAFEKCHLAECKPLLGSEII